MPRRIELAIAALAIVGLVAGAAIIGAARARIDRFLYISELGAQHMRTAEQFQIGFCLLVIGILLAAVVLRDERSRLPVLGRWAPAASLVASGGLFAVAAAVTCSHGCPSLLGGRAELQDWIHIVAAVLAFVAGCTAMVQLATARDRWVARISVVGGLAVGIIAATGGIISLARGNTDVGSTLEYIAAGLGVAWLVAMVVVHAVPHRAVAPSGVARARVALVPDAAAE